MLMIMLKMACYFWQQQHQKKKNSYPQMEEREEGEEGGRGGRKENRPE